MGSTGRSTGPHLHFEVLKQGRAVDPLSFVKQLRLAAFSPDDRTAPGSPVSRARCPLALRGLCPSRAEALTIAGFSSCAPESARTWPIGLPSCSAAVISGFCTAITRASLATNALEDSLQGAERRAARGQDRRVPPAAGAAARPRRPAARGVRGRARSGAAHARHAALRRAADRRHGAAPGQDRRDAHRRRQDAGRDAAGLPECAARQGRARRHGQRIPGAARRGLDGPGLPLPRPDGRRDQERPDRRREARRLRVRHHLRHQQRIRLRLPARQPRVPARGPRAARPRLRDRRRGGLDPDRRSAHAADHLGPGGREHRAVRADQRSSRRA